MKQIIKDIYHVGDNECSVYMVDTQSDQGLVLIDAGMNFNASIQPGHTPGSISIIVESKGKKVLFGQDLHGPFDESFLSNLHDCQSSMQKLLEFDADIICEGRFGIFQPDNQVRNYIETYKLQNEP